MHPQQLEQIITLRDELMDISPHKVRYRELARWSRVLSQVIQQEIDDAPAESA